MKIILKCMMVNIIKLRNHPRSDSVAFYGMCEYYQDKLNAVSDITGVTIHWTVFWTKAKENSLIPRYLCGWDTVCLDGVYSGAPGRMVQWHHCSSLVGMYLVPGTLANSVELAWGWLQPAKNIMCFDYHNILIYFI